jgi:periplasmic glucans biosynthesis protein
MFERAPPSDLPRFRATFRLSTVLSLAAVVMATLCFPAGSLAAFGFDNVAAIAKKLSEAPFQEPKGEVPDALRKISYDEWRDIRFRPERALWRQRGLPFEVQFFHPGLFYDRIVRIHSVDADGVHPVAFSPEIFDYGKNTFSANVLENLGYAGFRLHYPVNRPEYKDEIAVFLGATYFRAVGKGQVFGLSARGLAVDVGLPAGEEFPHFREFWLVRPAREARDIQVLALLDSRRVTGAYRFVVTPGERTVVDVEARIYPRKKIEKLGIAPLTSMFRFGENTLIRPADYRPEVHDSDGLLLALETGEWIFRPLDNPQRLNISAFLMTDPAGFGLVQRDRDFAHYQDLETRPDLRPSVWVTPRGRWGEGRVELVEIPSPEDIHDNIVAFWVPGEAVEPGRALSFSYALSWYADDSGRPPCGRAASTRRDRGTVEGAHRWVIDFTGKRLAELPADAALRAVVTVGSGTGEEGDLLEQQVLKNPVTGGWRLVFQVRPKSGKPLGLRAFLAKDGEALTETWASVLLP